MISENQLIIYIFVMFDQPKELHLLTFHVQFWIISKIKCKYSHSSINMGKKVFLTFLFVDWAGQMSAGQTSLKKSKIKICKFLTFFYCVADMAIYWNFFVKTLKSYMYYKIILCKFFCSRSENCIVIRIHALGNRINQWMTVYMSWSQNINSLFT